VCTVNYRHLRITSVHVFPVENTRIGETRKRGSPDHPARHVHMGRIGQDGLKAVGFSARIAAPAIPGRERQCLIEHGVKDVHEMHPYDQAGIEVWPPITGRADQSADWPSATIFPAHINRFRWPR
jgi:hypothetical protein